MVVTHASHILKVASGELYWPQWANELKEYVSKRDICLAHQSAPGKVPPLSHEMVARSWLKVAADLCELDGHTLLVVTDY